MESQPPDDVAPPELLAMLGILAQLFQARTEALLQPAGLSYTQMAVLTHLSRQDDGQSVSELAEAFEIQQPGMSKVIKRLDEAGAVRTKVDPSDPRRKLVSISTSGVANTAAAGEAVTQDVQNWFADWSDDEVAEFTKSVGRLVGWLDANRLGAE